MDDSALIEMVEEPEDMLIDPPILPPGEGPAPRISRATTTYERLDDDFRVTYKSYERQYYSIYLTRLGQLRSALIEQAQLRFGEDSVILEKILLLRDGEEFIVVGTLFKDSSLRPSVLESYEKDRNIIPQMLLPKYVHDDDVLILEDESGRVELQGKLPTVSFTSGMGVAVKGVVDDGVLIVSDYVFAGIPPQAPCPGLSPGAKDSPDDVYFALVSGLRIGDEKSNPLPVQLLVDYLVGRLGSTEEQRFLSRIVRVIIAGDSVVPPEATPQGVFLKNYQKKLTPKMRRQLIAPVQELDHWLADLASSMPVDLMPGPSDPANFNLPQQPLNRCMIPNASQYETYTAATNPHRCTIGDLLVFGSSGQPLANMLKYTDTMDPLDLLEETLRTRHCAPTAPDTLGCFPFEEKDPFVLDACPHVYFAGNQKEFAWKSISGPDGQRVSMVCVPSFQKSHEIVLVNMRTLCAKTITIGVDESSTW